MKMEDAMGKIIESILRHNIVILIVSALFILFGIYSYINIPKQEMPEIEAEFGVVQIIAPGLNSEEVSEKILEPLEEIVNEYSTIKGYTTKALDNACVLVIEMKLSDTNSAETLEKIRNDIFMADLDGSVTEINFILDLTAGEVIYAIYSDQVSEFQLEEYAKELAIDIKSIPNIANVKVNSTYSEEIVVDIDLEKLNSLPLTALDIYQIIYANGYEIPLGITTYDGKATSIRINSNYESIEEIENIILFADEMQVVKLSDIANVSLENSIDKKTYIFNGKPTVFLEVFFDKDIDYTVLGEDLEKEITKFEDNLPTTVTVTAMTFAPKHVQDQVNSIMQNLFMCIGIVLIIVLIGLGFRNALTIAISIPTIVLGTISVLYLSGNHLQLISIAGLIVSIGVIVDNSIVISEATQYALNSGMDVQKACVHAVKENYMPVLASTLTTIAAFVPLLFLPGIAGDVAFTLPLTILVAITISYIVSITLTPILARKIFKMKNSKHKNYKKNTINEFAKEQIKEIVTNENKKVKKIDKKKEWLKHILEMIFKFSIPLTLLAFLMLGVLGYQAFQTLEIDILPKTDKSIVYIEYEYHTINDKKGTSEFAKDIEEIVVAQDNIINYAYSQGGDLPKFDLTLGVVNELPHLGRFFIEYDCESREIDDYMKSLNQDLACLKESGTINVKRLELSQPEAPVQIILTSNDFSHLYLVSNEIFKEVEKLESYKEGRLVAPKYKTEVEIVVDRLKIAAAGLSMVEVEQQIALNVNGLSEALYDGGDKLLNVRLKNTVDSVDELKSLNIKSQTGEMVTLEDVAEIQEIQSLEYIDSYNGIPSITMDAYMEEAYSTYDLESDIKEIIDEKTDNRINVMYKGDNELTNELMQGMAIAFIVAIIVIYLIMYIQFKTLRQPLFVLVSIPLSFIGSLIAMLIFGEKITLTSLLGIVSLTGIVVNNGILLVDYMNKSRVAETNIFNVCFMAVNRRFRPILLTSATTILGLIPLALFGGDFFRPMAITFMGGLFSSTVFVLFLVPGLYYISYNKKNKKSK